MKRLRSTGLGVCERQAEPITTTEENHPWECKLLGSHSYRCLLDTMLFYCGLYFALRSEKEHRVLVLSQIQLIEANNEDPCLLCTENISKNNKGGLAQHKLEAKQVVHHANTTKPERCFVQLYKTYLQYCPENGKQKLFILLKKPKDNIWFSSTPVGHSTLIIIIIP